jgi:Tfp pilus assembly protein PilE
LSVEVDSTGQKYTLKATPQGAQTGDGKCLEFSLDSTGKKSVSGSSSKNIKECW